MKIVTVVGARPQFVKAFPLSRQLALRGIQECVVHTGQHYDERMSGCFFQELGLAEPAHNLGVGSGPHGAQTGAMLAGIERILGAEKPGVLVVYGDTNSTLAGALAAAKLCIPIVHVEAGLRSGNRRMPEEINRVMVDHLSLRRYCSSETGVSNLCNEGLTTGNLIVGDIMHDALRHFLARARGQSTVLEQIGLGERAYHVATLHRVETTEDPERLVSLLRLFGNLDKPVLMPMHPRTKAVLKSRGIEDASLGGLRILEPLGYLDMLRLVSGSSHVLTDSGGLQKEAYWLGRPCVTLRRETEWVETVTLGWNSLVGFDEAYIQNATRRLPPPDRPELYGDGHSAERIVEDMVRQFL